MASLLAALLLFCQEPSVAELIKRLDSEKFQDREEAQAALLTRGAAALKEVEAALATADAGELRIRLGRLVRPLRLAELAGRIPSQFSEGFRSAAPELIEKLKRPDPGTIIEAIAATTGRAQHWELEDLPTSHGETYKKERVIVREPVKAATRADVVEVLRFGIRAAEGELPAEWAAVRKSTFDAIKANSPADAKALFYELLRLSDDRSVRNMLTSMAMIMPRAERILAVLALVDGPNPELQKHAASFLSRVEPGRHGDDVAKRLAPAKPPMRVQLLHCLARTGDKRFVPTVLAFADSADKDERWAALDAAAKLDPDSVMDRVLSKLKSTNDEEMLQGLELAMRWKGPAKPPRPEYVKEAGRIFAASKNPKVSQKGFEIMLRAQGVGCTKEAVLHALSHADAAIRSSATWMAGPFKDPDVVNALVKTLDDSDDEIAASAASSLSHANVPCPVERLRVLVGSKSPRARRGALWALWKQLGKDSRDDLVALLDDPDPYIQMQAIDLLLPWAKGLEPRLRVKLESPNESVQLAAARTLVGLGDKECLPFVMKQLETQRWDYFGPLLLQLTHPDWHKRLHEIQLKQPGDNDTLGTMYEKLRSTLKDMGLDLQVDLPAHVLEREVSKPPYEHPESFQFGSIRSWLGGGDWFFDGKTFFILTPKAARERWIEWAKSK